jgi:hypothetical protein
MVLKTGSFLNILALKLLKTLFFTQKYLIRYTPKIYFEEYINLKNVVIYGVVEFYLFKVLGVIYAPSHPD